MKQQDVLKHFMDEFEILEKFVLQSKSPKHYTEIFNFFANQLHSEQVFYWLEKSKKLPADPAAKKPKQKFLSLHKTSLEEFNIYKKKFETIDFSKAKFHIDGKNLFLKLPSDKSNRYYCFMFKGFSADFANNEILRYFFIQRLHGLMNLIDKVDAIQALNFIDDVTGLYNQRYLNILLDQEIERYKRSNVSFSVLFIDVDHFKLVNDKNGHMVGSQILKEIGEIIKKSVRLVDFCFRYGGDEFLTILTNTNAEQATIVANRICKSVRETPFIMNGSKVQVTLSIGVACFPEHAQTKEKILQVADEAMYCGKNLSRNIVYLAG
ncbi:MAG: GGDEF domain-containing protein [Bdellovibrionota bacterium]